MRDYLPLKKTNNKLPIKEKVKFAILGNRLGLSEEEANKLLINLHKDVANLFSIHESDLISDVDFSGREFDFIFTINKKNIPDNQT
jgi:hypothetical protein